MSARNRLSLSALTIMLMTGPALAAKAPAQWQTVTTSAGSLIEIDKSRIARLKDGKTAAWTRLALDHPVLDFESQVRYTAVQALNHYDCAKGTFATQQRVFMLEGREMKTEKVSGRQMAIKPDSLDARLLDEVCKSRTVGEMNQTAARPNEEARPRAMHAEMVSAGDAEPPRSVKVADIPAAEKPRMFQMPLIDKSKAEDPLKGAAPTVPAKPAAAPAQAQPAAPVARPAPKSAFPVIPPQVQELSRQQREMMLATSGPRKGAPKKQEKPAEAPPAHGVVAHHPAQWGYAGPGAPENWGKLQPGYATCNTGKRQSPIDIRGGIRVDLEPIRFDYQPSLFRIVDNGHTVQVDVGEGSSITITGRTYALVQINFHRPAEERVNGKTYEMAAHLVHKDYGNNIAVVAVLIGKGAEHPVIQTLWNHMPLEVGMEVTPPNVALDLSKLLPQRREYYTYMGSLTTPPCTENVLWMVFREPIGVSPEQIGIFARLYPHNARPIQPAFDRLIKESR
ncbi:MAG: carbonic anhydrase family protein [Rhodocyclaceae bacterium]|nr:carbonic anhydrase family protein [Rhodocyclaceae bacterium]